MIARLIVLSLCVMGGGGQEIPYRALVPPRVIKMVKADYTKEAREARIEGTVAVEIVVSVEGVPKTATVVQSLDTKYGLDDEAVKASLEWRFTPATRQGEPVEAAIRVWHNFKLNQ